MLYFKYYSRTKQALQPMLKEGVVQFSVVIFRGYFLSTEEELSVIFNNLYCVLIVIKFTAINLQRIMFKV